MSGYEELQKSEEFKEKFSADPLNFLNFEKEIVFSLDPIDLDMIRLSLAQRKFSAAKESIAMVGRMAVQNNISEIDNFNDLLPLCYNQETYKGYPQSWLESGDFTRMTKWLSKLCAADLSRVDASSCELIEDWMRVLKEQSDVDLMMSAGAEGKASFLPRTRQEWDMLMEITYSGFSMCDGPNGESIALRPGIDRVPLVYPGARRGARSWRFMDFYEDKFGEGLVDAPLGYVDSDLVSLAGRIREASRKGEAGSLQINPKLLERKADVARSNAELPKQFMGLMDRMMNKYRGERIIFYGSMKIIYNLAQKFREQGVKGAYSPDSFIICGGGFDGEKVPLNWKKEVTDALGLYDGQLRVGYGMQEGLWAMEACEYDKYHVPTTIIPFVLDEDSDEPLPRTGCQTGRYAFFDLLPVTSWGGYITSDQVTMTFDQPCACGQKGVYIETTINKVLSRTDDKIGCAGTSSAVEEATEFLLKG